MPSPEVLALAATCLPGRGAIELEILGQGLFNDTYKARRDGQQFTLRMSREPAAAGAPARAFEARLLAEAGARGLAPPLIHSDAARGILVLKWLPGQTWEGRSLTSTIHIETAAKLMRRVHELPAPAPLRTCTPSAWVSFYRGQLALRAGGVPAVLGSSADRAAHALAKMAPVKPVVCHSDLHRLNVLQPAGGGLESSVLLDWEYAHQSEAAWDLAGWSANSDFTPAHSRALLAAYERDGRDIIPWQRFVLLRWLFDYISVLWIRLFQRAMPAAAAELDLRAARLETRLGAAVCGKLGDCERQYALEI